MWLSDPHTMTPSYRNKQSPGDCVYSGYMQVGGGLMLRGWHGGGPSRSPGWVGGAQLFGAIDHGAPTL